MRGMGGLETSRASTGEEDGFLGEAPGRGADIVDALRLGTHVYMDTNKDDAVVGRKRLGGA